MPGQPRSTGDGAITFVVRSYQRCDLLRQALESILAQVEPRDRVIVVDDGSTDDSVAVAQSFGPQVQIMRQSRLGGAVAGNTGMAAATTEFTWLFDDDDVFVPGAVPRMRAVLGAQPELHFCVAPFETAIRSPDNAWPTGTGQRLVLPPVAERGYLCPLYESNFIGTGTVLWRTSCLQALQGFDPRYVRSQDYHLALRAALAYRYTVVDGAPVYLYVQHDGARGSANEAIAGHAVRFKWLKYDQCLYFELMAPLPLDRFTEPGDASPGLAHINRARAAASKLLAVQCLDALLARCALTDAPTLTERERQRLSDLLSTGYYYGVGTLAGDDSFWRLAELMLTHSALGNEIFALLSAERASKVRRVAKVLLQP